MYCENKQFSTDIVHTNSKFSLKVHYTLIMNKIRVTFAFRPLPIMLYTLFCLNYIKLKQKYSDLPDDDLCATYICYMCT